VTIYPKQYMNQKRDDFGICCDSLNKIVYVFGGKTDDAINHCEKYSVVKDEWTEMKAMNRCKTNVSACIFDNQFIFVIGGSDFEYDCLNVIEKYSISSDTWETIQIAGDL